MDKTIFLKVKRLQEDIDASSGVLPRKDVEKQLPVDAFDQLVTDKALRKTVEKLYRDGHHARAVEEAYKFIDNLVKKTAKQGDTNLTGSKLMTTIFKKNTNILKKKNEKNTSVVGISDVIAHIKNGGGGADVAD